MNTVEALEGIIAWFSDEEHVAGWDDVHHHCLYLAPNGGRCAVGCLMPEDLLLEVHGWGMTNDWTEESVKAEGQTAGRMMQVVPKAALFFEDVKVETLEAAQQAHDEWAEGKARWRQGMNDDPIPSTREGFLDTVRELLDAARSK